MSLYKFSGDSPISTIEFTTSASGNVIAYVFANEAAPTENLAKVTDGLKHEGFFCTPYGLNDKPCLEVRKIGSEDALVNALRKLNAIKGEPEISLPEENIKTLDKIKRRSLQASGFFQTLGDINFFRYGMKNSSPSDMAAGVFYALGTGALLGYGRNDQSNRQVKDISDKLADYLEKNHIDISHKCSLKNITEDQKKGLIGSANDLLARYPSEVYNIFTGMAGLAVAHAAYNHKFKTWSHAPDPKTSKRLFYSGLLDMGLGLTTFSATMFGLLVKEKKKDPDEPPAETKIQQAWEWAQANPLSVTGMGLMVSTACHAVSTALDYRDALRTNDLKAKSAIPSRAGFVGMNIIAEILILISSKGHGEGVVADESVKKSIFASAAELIHSQTKDVQPQVFEYVSQFLSRPEVFAASTQEVKKELHDAIAKLQNNPWKCDVMHTEEKTSTPLPSPQVEMHQSVASVNHMQSLTKNNSDSWQLAVQQQTQSVQPSL